MAESVLTRRLLAAAAAFAAVLLCLPALIGYQLRASAIDSLTETLPRGLDSIALLQETRLRGGWFRSAAELDFAIPALQATGPSPPVLTLLLDLRHGPLLVDAQGPGIGLARAHVHARLRLPGAEPVALPGQALVNADLRGNLDMTLRVPVLADQGLPGIRLSGLAATLSSNSGTTSYRVDLAEIDLSAPGGQANLDLQGVLLAGHNTSLDSPLFDNLADLRIEKLSSSAPVEITLDRMRATSQLKHANPQRTELEFMHSLDIPVIAWGLPLESLAWQLRVAAVDMEFARDLAALLGAGGADGLLAESTVAAMPDLLAEHPPELEAGITVKAFGGEHRLSASLRWQEPWAADAVTGLSPWLDSMDLAIDLDADQAALADSPVRKLVEAYSEQGYLAEDGGRLRLAVRLQDTELRINGKIAPLETFFNSR